MLISAPIHYHRVLEFSELNEQIISIDTVFCPIRTHLYGSIRQFLILLLMGLNCESLNYIYTYCLIIYSSHISHL